MERSPGKKWGIDCKPFKYPHESFYGNKNFSEALRPCLQVGGLRGWEPQIQATLEDEAGSEAPERLYVKPNFVKTFRWLHLIGHLVFL